MYVVFNIVEAHNDTYYLTSVVLDKKGKIALRLVFFCCESYDITVFFYSTIVIFKVMTGDTSITRHRSHVLLS